MLIPWNILGPISNYEPKGKMNVKAGTRRERTTKYCKVIAGNSFSKVNPFQARERQRLQIGEKKLLEAKDTQVVLGAQIP